MGKFTNAMSKTGAALGITIATTSCIFNGSDEIPTNTPTNIETNNLNSYTVAVSRAPEYSSQDINIDECLDNMTDCIEKQMELSENADEANEDGDVLSAGKVEQSASPPDPPDDNKEDEINIECTGNDMNDFGTSSDNTNVEDNAQSDAEQETNDFVDDYLESI